MWDQGFETYARGHFGHGVGASIWSEEWPFISADSDAVLEPGMVMAFETPWYIDGLGGFIIEDQVLITETGVRGHGAAAARPYPGQLSAAPILRTASSVATVHAGLTNSGQLESFTTTICRSKSMWMSWPKTPRAMRLRLARSSIQNWL